MSGPGIGILIHGGAKVGKSYLADTLPAPRLILDAEGGTRFTPSKKVIWDVDAGEDPPATDETCVVYVRRYDTMKKVYAWLVSGKHPFRSVSIDSLSEVQQRCGDNINATEALTQQNWGELFKSMSNLVRSFRDLTFHPQHPLEVVMFTAMSKPIKMDSGVEKIIPYVQGQLATTLPYYIDVVGYLEMFTGDDGAPQRRLLTAANQRAEAGDRTGRLPGTMVDPDMPEILATINGTNK